MFAAFLLQHEELRYQRLEYKLTREEIERQTRALQAQRVELRKQNAIQQEKTDTDYVQSTIQNRSRIF